MAALARVVPSSEFSVDTNGCACPVGQAVRYESAPCGTTVTLNAYAAALAGIPHELDGIRKVRLLPPASDGPPKAPFGLRVSRTRQGVNGKNCSVLAAGGSK